MHPRREHPIFISIGLECWLRAIRYTKIVPRVVGEQFCVRKSFSGLSGSNFVYENRSAGCREAILCTKSVPRVVGEPFGVQKSVPRIVGEQFGVRKSVPRVVGEQFGVRKSFREFGAAISYAIKTPHPVKYHS